MGLTKISTGGVKDDAASQAKIADEAVDEARLQVSNAGTNGQFLQKQSGNTGGLTWAAANQYTHPNHSGEVSSTGDGAQTIASNVVDEDNLKVSNSPTNGQFLQAQSGNTGGLTWVDVSAAPQIEAVATGSIGANVSVKVNSDGTVSAVSQASPALGNVREFNGAQSRYNDACYNKTDNVVAIVYQQSSKTYIRFGTVSGDEITFSAATKIIDYAIDKLKIVHDENNNAYFIAHKRQDTGHGFWNTLTANGTNFGTLSALGTWFGNAGAKLQDMIYCPWTQKVIIAWSNSSSGYTATCHNNGANEPTMEGGAGSGLLYTHDLGGSNQKQASFAIDATNQKLFLSYYDSNLTEGFTRILTVSGNTISQGSAITWFTYGADYVRSLYDTTNNKLIITFTDGNDSYKPKVVVGTVSGSSISWSNKVDIDSSGKTIWPTMAFNSERGKIDYYARDEDDGDDFYYVEIDASGTHPTCTTKVDVETSYDYYQWTTSIFDPDTGSTFAFYNGSGGHGDYVSKNSGLTTLTTENFIGFSSAAYTNGQTAKINVVGNTTTQSSLTPAQKYYLKKDGTLALSPVTPSVEAGIALSSTKLLIKG